ncbi:SIAE [Symbiodinium sp. CCMP2592]|nr:SIAE [Symbiodinium sp. CCMP2592]
MPTSATVSTPPRDKIAELIRDTTSTDTHVRQAACQGLGSAARGDARLAPVLLKLLKDRDPYVRQAATTSLGQVARRGDEQVLEALVAQLGDSDSAVRRLACTSLGQVSNRSSSRTVAALVGRLEDRDGGVRRAAVKALEKVADKEDPAVLPQLFARTADVEAFVRHTAVEVLSRLAEEGNGELVRAPLSELNSSLSEWLSTTTVQPVADGGKQKSLSRLERILEECCSTSLTPMIEIGRPSKSADPDVVFGQAPSPDGCGQRVGLPLWDGPYERIAVQGFGVFDEEA